VNESNISEIADLRLSGIRIFQVKILFQDFLGEDMVPSGLVPIFETNS